MKLLLENWRKYLKEAPAAFHGYKMQPTQMRVSPQCDTPPDDNQWEAGEQAGIVTTNNGSPTFQASASNPWFNHYDDFKEDLMLIARDF